MRARPHPRRLLALPGLLLLAVIAGAPIAPSAAAETAVADRLPDLRMLQPTELRIERAATGERLLRFTTVFVNVGAGPFEVRGSRACTSLVTCPRMSVRQRFQRRDGTWHLEPTTARMKLEVGDHHNHWHVVGMERFALFDPLQPAGGSPLRGQKFGFCFFDTRPYRLDLPGAPTARHYVESGTGDNNGCGTAADLRTRMGLSVGWQDIYPWNFAGQYVDISGVPAGDYLLCVTADPKDRFAESNDANNQAWRLLHLEGGSVTVLDGGRDACARHLPPPRSEPVS